MVPQSGERLHQLWKAYKLSPLPKISRWHRWHIFRFGYKRPIWQRTQAFKLKLDSERLWFGVRLVRRLKNILHLKELKQQHFLKDTRSARHTKRFRERTLNSANWNHSGKRRTVGNFLTGITREKNFSTVVYSLVKIGNRQNFWSVLRSTLKMKSKLRQLTIRNKLHRHASWEVLSLPSSVFKVVVLGAGGVGKTSLIKRFVTDTFPQSYIPTVEDFYEKSVSLNKDFGAFFEILDTAGSYQFPAMKRLTIERGDAFVLVYSIGDDESIDELWRLLQEIQDIKQTNDIPLIIVGNKTDLVSHERREKVRQRIAKLVQGKNLIRSETSAKYGINVKGVFRALLGQIAVVNNEHFRRVSSSMTI